jgi:hypothetical protein
LVALNGKDEFLYWTRLPDGQEFNQQDILRSFQQACGLPLQVEVLGNRNWTAGVALWAEQFGSGKRIFLAGDAIHLFTPTGGFGMNTGIDGAANLARKLAASVQGWAGTHLLASYQTERQPVARRNTTAAQQLARNVGSVPVADCIEQNTAAGEDARRSAGAYLSTFGEEFGSIGVQLGVRYDGSRSLPRMVHRHPTAMCPTRPAPYLVVVPHIVFSIHPAYCTDDRCSICLALDSPCCACIALATPVLHYSPPLSPCAYR